MRREYNLSDAELLNLWVSGDRRAGDAFIRRHWHSVIQFFKHRRLTSDDANDLTGRVFERFYQAASKGAEIHSTTGYLHRTAFFELTHFIRVNKRWSTADINFELLADLSNGPEVELSHEEESDELFWALGQLGLAYQEILYLYYWEQLSGSEISGILRIPEGTTRGRLRLAKQRLAEVLTSSMKDFKFPLESREWPERMRAHLIGMDRSQDSD